MGKFRESRTARNLMLSFAGESQARNRYTYFARRAFEEEFVQVADIFETVIHQDFTNIFGRSFFGADNSDSILPGYLRDAFFFMFDKFHIRNIDHLAK